MMKKIMISWNLLTLDSLSLERILKSRKYKYVDYEGLGNGILKGK
jgi:hypothetical protein